MVPGFSQLKDCLQREILFEKSKNTSNLQIEKDAPRLFSENGGSRTPTMFSLSSTFSASILTPLSYCVAHTGQGFNILAAHIYTAIRGTN